MNRGVLGEKGFLPVTAMLIPSAVHTQNHLIGTNQDNLTSLIKYMQFNEGTQVFENRTGFLPANSPIQFQKARSPTKNRQLPGK